MRQDREKTKSRVARYFGLPGDLARELAEAMELELIDNLTSSEAREAIRVHSGRTL